MKVGESFALPGEGEAFHIKRSAHHGDPALQFDWTLEPGRPGPPLHVHREDDEIVRVLEGTARIQLGTDIHLVSAGTSMRLPAGIQHRIRGHGDQRLVVQVTSSPGYGFEQILDILQCGGFRGFAAMCQFVPANPQILRPQSFGIRAFMRVVGALGWIVGVRAPTAATRAAP
jgi:mannose-6-phosphate isomerase-like protein (cupin superfamily)